MDLRRIDAPFPLFEVDDALPAALYRRLDETKPVDLERWSRSDHPMDTRRYLRSGAAPDALAEDAAAVWGDAIAVLEGDAFRADMARALYGAFETAAAAGEIASRDLTAHFAAGSDPDRFADYLTAVTEPVVTLTTLGPGELNSPHADETRKWVTLLMYFPDGDWQPAWGGYTVFYRSLVPLESAPWYDPRGHNRVPPQLLDRFQRETEIFHRSSFSANTWCLFVKTKTSFHAVPPIRCPAGRWRYAVVMNVKGPV